MKRAKNSIQAEMRVARQTWSDLGAARLRDLRALLVRFKFSIALGEITRIDNRWYVTHGGPLGLASRRQCHGISTSLQERLCDPAASRWVFRAVVYKGPNSKSFVGYGDADPSNVSSAVQGAELRIAETRAVNRALRKATGSACVQSKSWAHFRVCQNPPRVRYRRMARTLAMVPATANRGFAINSAS
jgi:hypothetical protein